MLRKIILAIVIVYGAGLALFAGLLLRAWPASSGVPEIGIGVYGSDAGVAYISGRRLACEPLAGDPRFSTRCTVPIDGDLLAVYAAPASRSAQHFEGACEATFRGEVYRCQPGLRRGTVRTVALIQEPFGLTPNDLEAVREQYWVENDDLPSLHLVALLTAFVAFAGVIAWKPPSDRTRRVTYLTYPLLAGVAFVVTFVGLLGLTLYLWN